MFDYLQKFNNLPANLRENISSPAAMTVIADLENKYKIDLAAVVMKVMTKVIPLADLSIYFVSDFSLDQESAKKLTAELKERLFFSVANYLGFNPSYSSVIPKTTPAPAHLLTVEKIIKDSGVSFAGVELNNRLKSILTTYIKGVRSRIDTRLTLNKDVPSGGLGLDYKIIDKIFKLADDLIAQHTLSNLNPTKLVESPEKINSGLDKVRALYEKSSEVRDLPYDLKAAIASKAIKKNITPINLPIPIESQEKLLEAPDKEDVKPIIVPTVTKPVVTKVDVSQKDLQNNELKEVKSNIDLSKNISEPKKVVPPVIPIVPIPVIKPIAPISSIRSELLEKNVATPKIERPPARKTNVLAQFFHKKEEPQQAVNNNKTVPQVASSIASLRAEAANTKSKEVNHPSIKAQIIPKVMSPIDELKYLDLINFRRLGPSPKEAAEKVENKIKVLEKDGYDKMVAGVLSWRAGIINALYLKMGQEALMKDISLKKLAEDYQAANNSNYLTWEEIETILALNSRLVF